MVSFLFQYNIEQYSNRGLYNIIHCIFKSISDTNTFMFNNSWIIMYIKKLAIFCVGSVNVTSVGKCAAVDTPTLTI